MDALLNIIKPDELNFILTYGFGDTMTIVGLRHVLEKKYDCRIHFIIKSSHKIVMEMYDCTNYSIYEFSHNELICIGRDNYVPHKGSLYVAHPVFSDNCGLMREWNDGKVSYRNLLHLFLKIDESNPIQPPLWRPPLTQTMLDALKLSNVDLDRTVLLLPEARSVFPLNKKYWKKLVRKLRNEGFIVIQSCIDKSKEIKGVAVLPDDLYTVIAMALSCSCVYALRNGICDLIMTKVRHMVVFYTTEFHFNAYIMEGENIENVFIPKINKGIENLKQGIKKLPFIRRLLLFKAILYPDRQFTGKHVELNPNIIFLKYMDREIKI